MLGARVSEVNFENDWIPKDVKLSMFSLWDISQEELSICKEIISESEKEIADNYRRQNEKDSFILRRALMRITLSKELCISPEKIIIYCAAQGKPHVENNECYFNLSYSNMISILGYSKGREIGVDVEKYSPIEINEGLLSSFASEEEKIWIGGSYSRFLILWTAKEAFLKKLGSGFNTVLMPRLEIPPHNNRNCFLFSCQSNTILSFINEGYTYAVCFD